MKTCSGDTSTACSFFFLTATCDRIAMISLTFQPTVTRRVCLRVLVFKHAKYVSTNSNPTHFSAGPCGRTHYVLYKQVIFGTGLVCFCTSNTTRSNRFQTHTHALGLPITSIIVSLPRSGGESDDIALPRSVMCMCLIVMLNCCHFPAIVYFCFCTSNTTRSNRFQTQTRSRPTSIGN